MGPVLIAAAAAAAVSRIGPATAPAFAPADPAIWVVNDHDTTIYLFGTFHALDGRAPWFNNAVVTAFSASDELVLETVVPGRGAMPRVATGTGTGSFLEATRTAVSANRGQGMMISEGADAVLRRAAEASGKPVEGLESFSGQLGMLASLRGSERSAGASVSAAPPSNLGVMMHGLQSSWRRGDQGMMIALLDQMRAKSPATYRTMFSERNAQWAQWIAQRMQAPGTVFVAVGAGHLAGQDSVQAKLSQLGVRSARIN